MVNISPIFGLQYLFTNQSQKEVYVNQDLAIIDAFLQPTIISDILTIPPAAPADGDKYIVPSSAAGVWAGQTNNIALYSASSLSWSFFTPKVGWTVYNQIDSAIYVFSGTSWGFLPGRLVNVQVISATATYTPSIKASTALITCVGGGGGGGGVGTVAAGMHGGGGGGAGGYSQHFISTGLASVAVTIGAAGAAGAAANAATGNGGNGGNTSFGALCIANGGSGGLGASATAGLPGNGGAGGVIAAGAGNVIIAPGEAGLPSPTFTSWVDGGYGGASIFGGGLSGSPNITGAAANAGVAGVAYGSGGGGASGNANTVNTALGGAGAAGVCIVYEYS